MVMMEKYDYNVVGKEGSGGEYIPQDGFGWTNGLALDLIYKYKSS
jgi:alpha,alpha-trehalase